MLVSSLADVLHVLVSEVLDIANSNAGVAVIGGFIGAWAGVWVSQRITQRNKRREQLFTEMRNVNASIMLSWQLCNSLIVFKRQNVTPLKHKYQSDLISFAQWQQHSTMLARGVQSTFVVEPLFITLPPPVEPSATLNDIVYQRISMVGRGFVALGELDKWVRLLGESINMQRVLVERALSSRIGQQNNGAFYLGAPHVDGSRDTSYRDCLESIFEYTDHSIFFAAILCEELVRYGEGVRRELHTVFGEPLPNLHIVDLSGARSAGLLPSDDKYSAWLHGFF